MSIVHANNKTTISLGRQGENLARQVVFDLSDWVSGYGDGTAELIYQRPGDEQPYPVAAVRDGNTLVWSVSNLDTAVAASYGSYGRCELRWYVGEVLAKSQTWRTWVEPAMGTPAETAPPAPEHGWVEQVLATGAAAQQAAAEAKADADRAETLAAEVAEKAAQTAQDATESAQAKEAAQTAQRLAEEARSAAEAARNAAEAAQAAVAQSANDAEAAKQGAESALSDAQSAASSAAQALSDIRELYQQMQTWAQGVIQTINKVGSNAAKVVRIAGDAQVQRVADEGAQQTANAKAHADAADLSADAAAQSAKEAAESAAVYDDVVGDVTQLKADLIARDHLFSVETYIGKNKLNVLTEKEVIISSSGMKRWGFQIDGLEAGTYVLSYNTNDNATVSQNLKTGSEYSSAVELKSGSTIIIASGQSLILFDGILGEKITSRITNVQLEKGSIPTSYEPYKILIKSEVPTNAEQGKTAFEYLELHKGKNFFDKNSIGKVEINSTGTTREGVKIDNLNGEYVISYIPQNSSDVLTFKILTNGKYSDYQTIPSGAVVYVPYGSSLIIYYGDSTRSFKDVFSNVQLEKGTIPSSYEEYGEGEMLSFVVDGIKEDIADIKEDIADIKDYIPDKVLLFDDFNGSELDSTVWNVVEKPKGWANNELQEYVKDRGTVYVSEGCLHLKAIRKTIGSNNDWYSGRIDTSNKFEIGHGVRVEAKCKLPKVKGSWPAFWMFGCKPSRQFQIEHVWPGNGEIDIFEQTDANDYFTSNAWSYNGNNKQIPSSNKAVSDISDWHIYAVENDGVQLKYFVDSELFYTVDISELTHDGYCPYNDISNSLRIVLNLAVGGLMPSPPDDTTPDEFEFIVDYVKVTALDKPIKIEKLGFNANSYSVNIGKKIGVVPIINADSVDRSLTYMTLDDSIAKVDDYGRIEGVSTGSTMLFANSKSGKIAICKINVN